MTATQPWLCDGCSQVIRTGEEFEIHQGDFFCSDCITHEQEINAVTENTLILN
jgi:hypothetical protein